MILLGGIEEWGAEIIEDYFFKEQNVWIKLNQLTLNMQRYVLRHPEYAQFVENEMFQKAYKGDRAAEDFCMVNFAACRLELKVFYLLKSMEGDTRYTHENLLKFDDFEDYLPLF